jgi:hypothetical protein
VNRVILISVGCGVAGAAAGSAVTYFVTRKRIEKKAFAWANEEIESVKETYKLLRKEPPYDDPVTAAKAYMKRINDLDEMVEKGVEGAVEGAEQAVAEAESALEEAIEEQEQTEEIAAEAEEILETHGYVESGHERVRNIFDEAAARASIQDAAEEVERGDELSRRDPMDPFVISKGDFFDDSNEFEKITLSYYEGDHTLADEKDIPIPAVEEVVGVANLTRFGQEGSDSKDTVYIRNERLQTDYEVVRYDDEFAEVVYGQPSAEDNRKRVTRMRDDE